MATDWYIVSNIKFPPITVVVNLIAVNKNLLKKNYFKITLVCKKDIIFYNRNIDGIFYPSQKWLV